MASAADQASLMAMRTGGPTPEEQLAFRVVAAELGVSLDVTRELSAPNQVDAVLLDAAGTAFAALEVTALRDRERAESERLLAKDKHRWYFPELRWWWSVSMPASVRLNEAKTPLPVALGHFEQHGITHPEPSPFGPPSTVPAIQWYVDNEISAHGFTDVVTDGSSRVRMPGSVMVTPPGDGGFSGNVEGIAPWISRELQSSALLRSKLAKLQQAGFDEQHLFLFVDLGGAPYAVFDDVSGSSDVPAAAPQLETITHLWLYPTFSFSRSLLTWAKRDGWRRRPILDAPFSTDS